MLRPAFMISFKSSIQTNVTYITVEGFVFRYPAKSTFVAMIGVTVLAGEMLTLCTKIIRKPDLAG